MICKRNLFKTSLNESAHNICTQLNGFKYCYVTVTNLHQSFVCTHLSRYAFVS